MTREEAIEVYNGLINEKIKEAFEFFAPELAETKDERVISRIKKAVEYYWSDEALDEILAWLEKQKEKKPADWSEEDEKTLDCIINVLDRLGFKEYRKSSRDQDVEEERFYYKEIQCLKKLKSLRYQSHWKPSEEQMDYLVKAITTLGEEGYCKTSAVLNELRIELKKL